MMMAYPFSQVMKPSLFIVVFICKNASFFVCKNALFLFVKMCRFLFVKMHN